MNALVSIIVPVYNLEGYIDNCLKSLVNQTYRNLEILCIDDGSTDRSADVIKSFSEKDSRVIYVYKENGGVSSARNLGLDIFKGEYVMFVDGDDFLHPQAVEIFTDCIEKTGCDIACADALKTKEYYETFEKINMYSHEIIQTKHLYSDSSNRSFASVWSKLYRKQTVLMAKFPIGIKYGEDTNFMLKVLSESPKLSKVDKQLYYYFVRENSAETSSFSLNKATVLDSYDNLCEHFKNKEDTDLKSFVFQYLFQTICYIRTMCIGTKFEKESLEKCKKLGKKWIAFFWKCECAGFNTKVIVTIFFYSRHLYELARLIADPTMIDFYKNRRKHNGDCQKD